MPSDGPLPWPGVGTEGWVSLRCSSRSLPSYELQDEARLSTGEWREEEGGAERKAIGGETGSAFISMTGGDLEDGSETWDKERETLWEEEDGIFLYFR